MSGMDKILKDLNISEKFTKPIRPKPKGFTSVKSLVPLIENYNYMADLLFLPTTKQGFKYLLTVTDLADDSFDMEPLKRKEAGAVLKALKEIFKRPYLDQPKGSIQTDPGTEFKGVFHKYLYDNDILHKVTLPGRHTQQGNVERLNRTLGRLLNGYMNTVEFETGREFREWVAALPEIRRKLNKVREKKLPDYASTPMPRIDLGVKSKYKVGDVVYRALDEPRNVLGAKQSGTFREGDLRWDLVPRKVVRVLRFPGAEPIRYMVSRIPNASFTERQLMFAEEATEEHEVKQLLELLEDEDGVMWYRVWWKGQKKRDATLVPRDQLIDDVPKMVQEFESM